MAILLNLDPEDLTCRQTMPLQSAACPPSRSTRCRQEPFRLTALALALALRMLIMLNRNPASQTPTPIRIAAAPAASWPSRSIGRRQKLFRLTGLALALRSAIMLNLVPQARHVAKAASLQDLQLDRHLHCRPQPKAFRLTALALTLRMSIRLNLNPASIYAAKPRASNPSLARLNDPSYFFPFSFIS